MDHQFVNYCLECEWTASTDGYNRTELSRLAVDHACSTGHDIAGERPDGERDGSDQPPDREATRGEKPGEGLRPAETGPGPSARQSPPQRRVYSLSEEYRTDGDGHGEDRAETDGRTDGDDPDSGR
jgi:hypothetical protein